MIFDNKCTSFGVYTCIKMRLRKLPTYKRNPAIRNEIDLSDRKALVVHYCRRDCHRPSSCMGARRGTTRGTRGTLVKVFPSVKTFDFQWISRSNPLTTESTQVPPPGLRLGDLPSPPVPPSPSTVDPFPRLHLRTFVKSRDDAKVLHLLVTVHVSAHPCLHLPDPCHTSPLTRS